MYTVHVHVPVHVYSIRYFTTQFELALNFFVLFQERKENADLEAEVQSLRRDNIRLQEESQTAAAQLRKFTEWFFQTIDRQ